MRVGNKGAKSYDIQGAAVIPSCILKHFVFSRSASKRRGIRSDKRRHFKTKLFCWAASNSGTWMLRLWESLLSTGNLVNVTWKSGETNTRKVTDVATTTPPQRGYPTVSVTVIFYDPIRNATGSNLHLASRHTDTSGFSQATTEISPPPHVSRLRDNHFFQNTQCVY